MGQRSRWKGGAIVVGLVVVAGCKGKACVYRPGGTSAAQAVADAVADSPECREVRRKHDDCMGGIFDPKFSCGPEEGECVASARARLACKLAIPGNYECRRSGDTKMMSPMTPQQCQSERFVHLCTGTDEDTTVPDAGAVAPRSSG